MTGVPTQGASAVRVPRAGEPLPLFTLPNSRGQLVRLWDFKQRRPVALYFIHGADCLGCRETLAALAARRDDLAELRAAVLVIAPDAAEKLSELRAELGLPFSLLSDAEGSVRARYLPDVPEGDARGMTALFVADRYGACGLAARAREATELPSPQGILAEVALAEEGTCACLVPAWPEATAP